MKISIDPDRCEGHGLCEQQAPDYFRLDDDPVTVLQETVRPDDISPVRKAAAMCPKAAILLTAATPNDTTETHA